jgi:hypothetical protein
MKLAVANMASKFKVIYGNPMSDDRLQKYLPLSAPQGSQYMAQPHATV